MIFNELGDSDANLTLLLRNQISQADRQQQPSYLSWDALNSLMVNIGDEQFDYDSFKNSYDTNPMIKQLVQRFDARGVELKTKNKNPKKGQPGGEGEVAKMAKAATARRQNESYSNTRQSLFEGLDSQTVNEALVWKRILRPIVEAQLTPDQINTLFTQAQQVATAGGGNRTGIGKGVDYVAAKAEAWEKIKTSLQNTGPVSGFEAQYDKLAAKIKEKTGGDQGIMKYIQQYRDLAIQYPKTQKFVYGLSIALVGILALGGSVAAMSGGPIILGLLKMTDRLLQGDKLTSAIWQGVKTGALAAVGVGVGKGIRNMLGFGVGAGGGGAGANAADAAGVGKLTAKAAVDQLKQKFLSGEIKDYPSYQNALRDVFSKGSISGQLSLDQQMVSSQLEKQLGITFKGQYPDAVTDAGAKLMKQAGVQDMTGQSTGKLSTGETPAQQAARYAKNDVGNTPGQQATKDALRAGNADAIEKGERANISRKIAQDQAQASKAGFEPTGDDDIDHIGQSKINGKWVNNNDPSIAKQGAKLQGMMSGGTDILNGPPEIQGNKQLSAAYKALVNKIQSDPNYNVRNLPGDIQRFASQNSVGGLQATKDASTLNLLVQKAGGGNMNGFLDAVKNAAPQVARGATSNPADFESAYESRLSEQLARQMSESQIKAIFRQVDEGVWDTVKQGAGAAAGAVASGAKAVAGSRIGQAVGATAKDAAGAVAQKVGTAATNITTKVTADKLMKAWKAAKSPTDSAQVYKIMKAQGLDDATLSSVFKAAGIEVPPATSAAPAPTAAPAAGKGFNVKLPQKAAPAAPAPAPKAAPAAAPAPAAGQETDAQRRARIKAKQQAFKSQQGLKESMEYMRLSIEYNKIKS